MSAQESVYAILYLLAVVNIVTLVTGEDPLVKSNVGPIRGLRAKDGNYSMFLGVPFAQVNKTNPFGESLPYPYFKTEFEAYDDTAMCPQEEEFNNTIVGSLDCLRLNIYVPSSANATNRLPVLAYIYGGNFRIGFAGRFMYGPKYLVRHGIILVTFNYRLGPYGFFCTDTPEVPGNQAYKDQLTALKWIHRNIEAFGGDSDKITLTGHSLGATSVDYILHSLSGKEKIVDKAITQSPSIYCPDAFHELPRNNIPIQLARYLGLKTVDVNEALSFMSTIEPEKLIAATLNLSTPYTYCMEKKFDGVESFFSDYTVNLKVPSVKDMPILIGNTDSEGLFMYDTKNPEYFEKFEPFHDALLYFDFPKDYRKEMETIIRQAYIGDEKISERVKKEIILFSSDYYYCHVARRNIQKYIENGAGNIYYYIFSYNGGRNFLKNRLNITTRGATHCDELGYLFDMSLMDQNPNAEDQLMIDRITLLWANFIKYGDPTPETTELLPVKWKPITNENQYYMNIDSNLTLKSAPFHRRMAFWDLFCAMNGKMQRGYREGNDGK